MHVVWVCLQTINVSLSKRPKTTIKYSLEDTPKERTFFYDTVKGKMYKTIGCFALQLPCQITYFKFNLNHEHSRSLQGWA